ncbi:MAG: hypothetical protein AAFY88_05010 [Acidobacteriota bacterium]
MTIQQFASDLASSAKNDLVAVMDQFRRDENASVVFATGDASIAWFDWGRDGDESAPEPVGA